MVAGGYAWWYVDALSDDGQHALTLIAMLGNVFSPHYARARARSAFPDPLAHCTMNVVLHGPRSHRFALTERGRSSVTRTGSSLTLGPSAMRWEGDALVIDLDEATALFPKPIPGRIRGRVRVVPRGVCAGPVSLDPGGRHQWFPLAPSARVEVTLRDPDLRWTGSGYHDANTGTRALEDDFDGWQWSRAEVDGSSVVLYDTVGRDGLVRPRALHFRADGSTHPYEAAGPRSLSSSGWGVGRSTRCDPGAVATVRETLLDAPFYTRSVLSTRILGRDVAAMHEAVDLRRFASRWVQFLVPFKMRRG